MIGGRCPAASSTRSRVSRARGSAEVYATPNLMSEISLPARRASARPCSVRGTSTHPVKRFSRFHSDWPWRISTSLDMSSLPSLLLRAAQVAEHGLGHAGGLGLVLDLDGVLHQPLHAA